ncbi:abortive infection system antitoxin AbiGi family protein [Bacillus cereus]|uniref:abortive infection system antitoxin AbiGi family protein n=1 Tax=Bacillus cereus TaxID=1396 RepID=UPI003D66215C
MTVKVKQEIESISISVPEKKEPPKYKQSANVLFNFMKQLEYLKMNLKNKAFLPRYYEEKVSSYNIGVEKIAFPMTCFCDIHLQRIEPHVDFYGTFGIGLEKKWGVENGVQPIQYANIISSLFTSFTQLFLKSIEEIEEDSKNVEEYKNYLLMHLMFLKPINGDMLRYGKYEPRTFHDEKEWRFVPKINEEDDLDLLIPQDLLSPKVYDAYSDAITTRKDLWLHYEYDDIRYLIVETKSDRIELIRFITEELNENIEPSERSLLISKIIVWEEMKEDW